MQYLIKKNADLVNI